MLPMDHIYLLTGLGAGPRPPQLINETEIQLLLDNIRHRSRWEREEVIYKWLDADRLNQMYVIGQQYERSVNDRVEGTCEWIFNHSAYQDWDQQPSKADKARIFWLNGPAGHGKTVLCAKVIERAKESEAEIGYFFSSSHAESSNDPVMAVRCWLAQIARYDPEVQDIIGGYAQRKESAQISTNREIWAVFEIVVSHKHNCTFFLDGFDEYSRSNDTRAEFLQRLTTAVSNTGTRVFVSSRDETDIRAELAPRNTTHEGVSFYDCKISRDEVQGDISLFSRQVVNGKLTNKAEDIRSGLAAMLAEKCDGMFLWIKLQKEKLSSGKNKKQLERIVSDMPSGLSHTYDRKWKMIMDRPEDEKIRIEAILRWTMFASRPLTIAEITEVLIVELYSQDGYLSLEDLPDAIDDHYVEDEIIKMCEFLIEARPKPTDDSLSSRTIHFVHPSVREYMFTVLPGLGGLPPGSPASSFKSNSHSFVAKTCIAYLGFEDTWANLDHPGESVDENRPLVDYATRFWHSHITEAEPVEPQITELIVKFLSADNDGFSKWRACYNSTVEANFEAWDPTNDTASPLYFAALFSLNKAMEQIYLKDPTQLNATGGQFGTALQAACAKANLVGFQKLKEWKADPDAIAGQYGTALVAAATIGSEQLVKELITLGGNVEAKDSQGQTPLYWAARYGHSNVMKLLLDSHADYEVKNNFGWTPLNSASDNGHLKAVALLVNRNAIMVANDYGWTPVNNAAEGGHLEIVKLLLDHGADITIANVNGWTPLNSAASGGHIEVVKLLLAKGADHSVANKDGWTPLCMSVSRHNLELASVLLDAGADYTMPSVDGWTPLNLACSDGYLDLAQLFLDKGADLTVANSHGWTPLNLACSGGHSQIVQLLLDRGGDPNVPNNAGCTPLNIAAGSGYLEIVERLLEHGADHALTDENNWTPLNNAANSGHAKVVKLLIDHGADHTVPTVSGYFPLSISAKEGHIDTMKILLECGADQTAIDSNGWTPLYYAVDAGHYEAAKILIDSGAGLNTDNPYWDPLTLAASNGDINMLRLLIDGGLGKTVNEKMQWGPLHSAADHGHIEAIKLLLDNKVGDINGSLNNWTPISSAADSGHLDIVKLLIGRGANFTVVDRNTWSPLNAAAGRGHIEILRYLLDMGADYQGILLDGWNDLTNVADNGFVATVELLLERGLDPKDSSGLFPSLQHLFAYKGRLDLLDLYLNKHPQNIEDTDSHGRTIFHFAARGGHAEVFNQLQPRHPDVANKILREARFLEYACFGGSLQIVDQVLTPGDMHAKQEDNHWSPLHWAFRAGDAEVIENLVEHGFRNTTVKTLQPEAEWTPFSVASFFGKKEVVKRLSESCKSILGLGDGTLSDNAKPPAITTGYVCNGCLDVSFLRSSHICVLPSPSFSNTHLGQAISGRFFHCAECLIIDYCFMCKPTYEHLHDGHTWQDYPLNPDLTTPADIIPKSRTDENINTQS
jgi:ankyrin repeat protein